MRSCLSLAFLLVACSSTPRPAPVAATPAPIVAPPTVVAKPTLQRLAAGGLGGTPHLWSARYYELRPVRSGASGAAFELRIHDEAHFQGVGMRPDQMPPARHTCTAWEPLPADIRVPPSATSCGDAKAECTAIEKHLRATDRSTEADAPRMDIPMSELAFGRGKGSCE
jgi:hypothetical protein